MGTEKIADKITVRPMKVEDIGFILDIDQKLTGTQRAMNQADIVTADIGEVHNLSFVADLDGKVIGFILARQVYLGEPAAETCVVQIIGVDPTFGRQGVATKLLSTLMEACKARKIQSMRVTVSDRDSKTEGFYKHVGFKQAPLKVYNKPL